MLVLSISEKEVTPSLAQATLAMVHATHLGNNVQAVASITPSAKRIGACLINNVILFEEVCL